MIEGIFIRPVRAHRIKNSPLKDVGRSGRLEGPGCISKDSIVDASFTSHQSARFRASWGLQYLGPAGFGVQGFGSRVQAYRMLAILALLRFRG